MQVVAGFAKQNLTEARTLESSISQSLRAHLMCTPLHFWEHRRKLVFANDAPVRVSKESKADFAAVRFAETYHRL